VHREHVAKVQPRRIPTLAEASPGDDRLAGQERVDRHGLKVEASQQLVEQMCARRSSLGLDNDAELDPGRRRDQARLGHQLGLEFLPARLAERHGHDGRRVDHDHAGSPCATRCGSTREGG
jgi:hypothetical protein